MYSRLSHEASIVTTEQISKYHPDKYADQISDAIVAACLTVDSLSHVACETLVKDSTVVLAGEITTKADIDYSQVVRDVASSLNYRVDRVINLISAQSPEINKAVVHDGIQDNLGAGDQGIVFGYAVNSPSHDYLPLGVWATNLIIAKIEDDVEHNPETILKGDAKCQVVDAQGSITEVLISACLKDTAPEDEKQIAKYIKDLVSDVEELKEATFVINPSGRWTIGGPTGDCGLTGRKLVCDAYGGYAPIGGGCTSGKDLTKVDRSGAYASRKLAVEVLKKYQLEDCLIQLSYGIGLSEPRSVSVTGHKKTSSGELEAIDLSQEVAEEYDLSPKGLIAYLHLDPEDLKTLSRGNYAKWFC